MTLALWLFPLALALSFLCMPFLVRAAPLWGLMDNPGGRKRHERETPLVGGLAIIFGILPVLMFVKIAPEQCLSWLLGAFILVILGLYDDHHELRSVPRFIAHLAVGLVLWIADRELTSLGNLIGQGPVLLGWVALPVTLFAVAAAINSMNMVDGIDGLLGSLASISLVCIMFLAWRAGLVFEFGLAGCLLMSLLVFLCFNLRFPWTSHARVFMGDAGSTLVGFSLAWLLISLARQGAMVPVLALYLLALPLLDTAGVIFRRYRAGLSAATPGRDHLHHILLDAGFSSNMTLLTLTALALLIAGIGMLMRYLQTPEMIMFGIFMFMLFCYLFISSSVTRLTSRLRYWRHELSGIDLPD